MLLRNWCKQLGGRLPRSTRRWRGRTDYRTSSRLACEPLEDRRLLAFNDIGAGLTGVSDGSVAWGDYDNDGDLDVLLSGFDPDGAYVTQIWRKEGGTFADITAGLTGVGYGSVAWGDYDNDGDLDVLLSGYDGSAPVTQIWQNEGDTFADITADLTGVSDSSVAWGDYDNDGDLDVLLSGEDDSDYVTQIWRNDDGTFADISAGLTAVSLGSVAWGDYDNDGDLDVLLSGDDDSHYVTQIWRNDDGTFADITAGLTGVVDSSVAWGDYDNDGDLDVLLSGDDVYAGYVTQIRRNEGGTFADISAGLTGVRLGSVAWGDYDNDGDLDVLLSGTDDGVDPVTQIWRNDDGTFADITAGLTGVVDSSVAWGDYDNDGDLDVLLSGYADSGPVTQIWENDIATSNAAPAAPTDLAAAVGDRTVRLSWTGPSDNPPTPGGTATPPLGLNYNLRVGTTSGGSNVVGPMSFQDPPSDGLRKIAQRGLLQGSSWTLTGLAPGTYYWSVQAIDTALAGSPFATEQSFELLPIFASFSDITAGLTDVGESSVAWGDYDNDGDLDVLLSGRDPVGAYVTQIWRNDGGTSFTDISAGLTGLDRGSVAWGDYDNDGDLDVLLSGSAIGGRVTQIWRNDGGTSFTDISAGLTGAGYGSVAWGDYDNDGDLDVLLSGTDDGGDPVTQIWENDDGTFADISAGLTGVYRSSVAWGDYDNDGDLDVLLSGRVAAGGYVTQIWENKGGTFEDITAGLTGVSLGSVAWGDYDNDGDLDVLLSGYVIGSRVTQIWENKGGTFEDISAGLTGLDRGSVAWGDYDNDGDLDVLLSGRDASLARVTQIWRNDDGTFEDIAAGLTGVSPGSVAWGDYDNDGDLDVLLSGRDPDAGLAPVTQIWQNDILISNAVPAAPTHLTAAVAGGGEVTLSWTGPSDNPPTPAGIATPQAGLNYNLRVGTTPGGSDVVGPMSFNATSGLRKIAQRGLLQGSSWTLTGLAPGTYYWSVQAIDTALAGSPFATEQSFDVIFTNIGAGLTAVNRGSVAWGDYDNDGDLDVLLSGRPASGGGVTQIWQYTDGTFADIAAGLTGVDFSSVAWGDYDNDGDLDVLLSGSAIGGRVTQIWRNEGGTFADITAGLTGVQDSSVAWGDYDNDGDLDVLLSGSVAGGGYVTQIWRNEGGTFVDITAGLTGVRLGSVAWGDYDNDGDLDVLLSGSDQGGTRLTQIWQNEGGTFADITAGLTGVDRSSVAWGDYDNDGDLDVLLSGTKSVFSADRVTQIWENDAGTFSDITAGLTGVFAGSVAWGDYDNDGDLDVLLSGSDAGGVELTQIWRNVDGTFADITTGLTGVEHSSVAWGDYDNDGDLDVLLSGSVGGLRNFVSQIWRNDILTSNAAPAAPTGLAASVSDGAVTLSWTPPLDNPPTPAGSATRTLGLSYNLRVGTTSGGSNVVGPMSFQDPPNDGLRKIAQRGLLQGSSWTLTGLAPGTYYWSVQAIDTALAGSPFATEQSFQVGPDSSLTVTIAAASISEGDGPRATTATVSRNTDTTEALIVALSSGDTTEATVPATVTIPAGQSTSLPFDIDAIDDALLDGTQTVTITATAGGHADGTDTVDVTDDDVAELTLTIAAASISEGDGPGATTATVSRNTDTTEALIVALSSGDTTEATVPATVTIAAGQSTSLPFDIDAIDDALLDGTQTVTITATAGGHADGTDTVDVTDDDVAELTLTIAAASISEGDGPGATTATVSRNTDTTEALIVALSSGDTTEATVPATVTIPAGQSTSLPFDIDAIDDALLDGTQTVTITATAGGHADGTDTVDVTDDDVAELTLTIAAASISEGDGPGATTATVSRNTDTTEALIVALSSGDTTEATVPATVTIPAGQSTSLPFDIDAIDDALLDGTQTVTITATAGGHADGTDTVDVTDDDVAELTLTIAAASISEGDGPGATTATVSRNTDTTEALIVALSSGDTSEATVPATVTIAAGQSTSLPFDIDAIDDALLDGTQTVTITATAGGHADGTDTVDVTDDDVAELTLTIAAASISEGDGPDATTATVSRNTDTTNPLTVTLASSDTSEATVPATVTIPAGQSISPLFDIDAIDDALLDGTQTVTITATADGHADGSDTLDVTDNDVDVAELTVVIAAASISEGDGPGATTATVSRNTDTTNPLTVTLTTSDTSEVTVPATVSIPAGQSISLPFDIDAIDDAIVDGTQTVTITATATAHADGSDTVDVTDNDVAELTVTIAAASISEGDGPGATTATVSRNTDTTNALVVTLASSDTSEATVPFTVTIPEGQSTSLPFGIDAIDDAIVDGTQTVTITASVADHAAGSDTLDVTDDDGSGVGVVDGVLQIVGTSEKDRVHVDKRGSRIKVRAKLDGGPTQHFAFDKNSVDSIVVFAFEGNDHIHISHRINVPATIDAGAGRDRVIGGSGDDLIRGGDGNDYIWAGWGDDMVFGEAGNDRIFGGWGDDTLRGGDGFDRLFGGFGDDDLFGDAGRDRLFGGFGDDELNGGDGVDRLFGGFGNDDLFGDAGRDWLFGGFGDDQLNGGDGIDRLFGGPGRDTLVDDDRLDFRRWFFAHLRRYKRRWW